MISKVLAAKYGYSFFLWGIRETKKTLRKNIIALDG